MRKPSVWFWIAGVVFLLWNAIGCAAYLAEVTMSDAAYAERYGEGVAALRDSIPSWSVAGYAIAVWVAAAASVLFLLRRKLAVPLFIISLVGAVAGFLPLALIDGMMEAMGTADLVMPAIVLVAALAEIFVSRRYAAKGVLR